MFPENLAKIGQTMERQWAESLANLQAFRPHPHRKLVWKSLLAGEVFAWAPKPSQSICEITPECQPCPPLWVSTAGRPFQTPRGRVTREFFELDGLERISYRRGLWKEAALNSHQLLRACLKVRHQGKVKGETQNS